MCDLFTVLYVMGCIPLKLSYYFLSLNYASGGTYSQFLQLYHLLCLLSQFWQYIANVLELIN